MVWRHAASVVSLDIMCRPSACGTGTLDAESCHYISMHNDTFQNSTAAMNCAIHHVVPYTAQDFVQLCTGDPVLLGAPLCFRPSIRN